MQRGISSAVVAPVFLALRELGVELPAELPMGGDTVPGESADRIFDHAAAQLKDEALGVNLARRIPIGALGPLDYALVTASSLREGVERTAQHYHVVTQRVSMSLLEAAPHATIALDRHPGTTPSRHWIEFSFALITQRLRQAVGPEFKVEQVTFAHPAPSSSEAHRAFFEAPVQFATPRDQLTFPVELLARPLRTAVGALGAVLEGHLRSLGAAPPVDPFLAKLRAEMLSLLDEGDAGVLRAAQRMAVSRRTLQRELQRRGRSHQELLDELRRERAVKLLEDERNTVASVAEALGFSESSAFFRAFRRWTGMSPSAVRAGRLR